MRFYFCFASQAELIRAQQRLHEERLATRYELEGMGFDNVAHIVVDTPALAGQFCEMFATVPLKFRFGWVGEDGSSSSSGTESDSDSGPLSDVSEGTVSVSSPPPSDHPPHELTHSPTSREE